MVESSTKLCIKCNESKALEYFEYRQDTKKYRPKCRNCLNIEKGYRGSRKEVSQRTKELLQGGFKMCGKCKDLIRIELFSIDAHSPTGLTSYCRPCKNKENKQNRSHLWSLRLKKLYNITVEDYEKLHDKYKGGCHICGITIANKLGWRLVVDHSHITGKVRGLLCHNCNAALGLFKDRSSLLIRAADYLTQ